MSNGVVAVNEVRAGVEVRDVEMNDIEPQVVNDVDDERYGEWQDVDRELRSIARRQSGLEPSSCSRCVRPSACGSGARSVASR
jgi:hypothetical protein